MILFNQLLPPSSSNNFLDHRAFTPLICTNLFLTKYLILHHTPPSIIEHLKPCAIPLICTNLFLTKYLILHHTPHSIREHLKPCAIPLICTVVAWYWSGLMRQKILINCGRKLENISMILVRFYY